MSIKCEICGNLKALTPCYEGEIRDGASQGKFRNAIVYSCKFCGVERLNERDCLAKSEYETSDYRIRMGQGLEAVDFFNQSDRLQPFNINALWKLNLRGKFVADIGCGAGGFLDCIRGIAKKVIGVEPTNIYRDYLNSKNSETYQYAAEALLKYEGQLDVVTSFHVIEHVEDPNNFVIEIARLLNKGGTLVLATPNKDDILIKMLPNLFPRFFYRVAHRFYFGKESLVKLINNCQNLEIIEVKYMHTFGLGNALHWLRDKCPMGDQSFPMIDYEADQQWANYLESRGASDTIMVFARKI